MKKYNVDISAPAENDLLGIVRYIAVQISAPVSALKLMDDIEDAIAGLANMPRKYPLVADERLASMGYRKLIIKNYIAFFTIDENANTVDVERILYMRRDWIHIL